MATPSNVPGRRPVTDELKRVLEEETGFPVGVATAPIDSSTGEAYDVPYVVVFPLNSLYSGPKYQTPEADATFHYSIHSIGLRDDQVQSLADRVTNAVIGRSDDGSFVIAMSPSGLTVMDRMSAESPGPLKNEGKIFSVVDVFSISVTTS